ncbi:MAG TPA: CotS family spore coat protein [Lachnospiraceae bacterium]|nr:CotS family spore coat protein [Lachnospiraceae bacterium]
MEDRRISLLESYDLQVLRTYKGRGALICETDKGLKILREFSGTSGRVALQDKLLQHIKSSGNCQVDCYVKNKEDQILVTDRMNISYALKDWYEGTECNVKSMEEISAAAKNLAMLHRLMQVPAWEEIQEMPMHSMKEECEKHTRELKKIRSFMRNRSRKSEFELYFAKHYDLFFAEAITIIDEMKQWDEEAFLLEVRKTGQLCHGEYTYHNILMNKQEIATVNFEKFQLDTGMRDLYQFMRKVSEKNDWDINIGKQILESYESVCPITKEERRNLYFRLAYPDKFWKTANYYYNSNKAWIPEKNTEKLRKLVEQNQAKHSFLQQVMLQSRKSFC